MEQPHVNIHGEQYARDKTVSNVLERMLKEQQRTGAEIVASVRDVSGQIGDMTNVLDRVQGELGWMSEQLGEIQQLGRMQVALLADMLHAIRNPEETRSLEYQRRAIDLLSRGLTPEARVEALKALEHDAYDWVTHYTIALIDCEESRLPEARQQLALAQRYSTGKSTDGEVKALLLDARVCDHQGDRDSAIALTRQARALHTTPETAVLLARRLAVLQTAGQDSEIESLVYSAARDNKALAPVIMADEWIALRSAVRDRALTQLRDEMRLANQRMMGNLREAATGLEAAMDAEIVTGVGGQYSDATTLLWSAEAHAHEDTILGHWKAEQQASGGVRAAHAALSTALQQLTHRASSTEQAVDHERQYRKKGGPGRDLRLTGGIIAALHAVTLAMLGISVMQAPVAPTAGEMQGVTLVLWVIAAGLAFGVFLYVVGMVKRARASRQPLTYESDARSLAEWVDYLKHHQAALER